MIDLLLMASTIALLILAQLLRMLLALRMPQSLQFKPIALDQPPDVMQDLFEQADRALTDLGFSPGHWATVHSKPALPGMVAPLVRLYHHPEVAVIARVNPPHSVFSTDRCQIVFLSISEDKRLLATANRIMELFPRPPETRVIMLNTRVDEWAEQFQAHCQAMKTHGLVWRDDSPAQGEKHWSFKLANYYEKVSIKWYRKNRLIKPQADGSATPTLWVALRFMGRFFTGHEHNPPRETSPIPVERAAYLFHNWQLSQSQPLPTATQLGIFTLSSIAFVVLAGIFWDWQIGLLLLGVILFHEFGHWLAMRLLGYRNLQILMLPLVGGVTLGQESTHKVSHRAIVSLMGPLPGILAGTLLLALNGMQGEILPLLAILLLAVNYLNLLPFMPLDGGQLLKALIPHERLGLMVALDWLGVAGLLLLGWFLDSTFISMLALIPLFSSLALMKKHRIFERIGRLEWSQHSLGDTRLAASVIQAMDETDKTYRPLEKKAAEIADIIGTLKLERARPAIAGLLIATYLGLFAVPPAVAISTSDSLRMLTQTLFQDMQEVHRSAYEEALSLSTPELLNELESTFASFNRAEDSDAAHHLLNMAAGDSSIREAERRLNIRFENDYRTLLRTSNGINTLWNDPTAEYYLLSPIEQVARFRQALDRLQNRRPGTDSPSVAQSIQVTRQLSDGEYQEMTFDVDVLGEMLLIGSRSEGEYLLMDNRAESAHPGQVIQLYMGFDGLAGSQYSSLKSFLADQLANLKMAAP